MNQPPGRCLVLETEVQGVYELVNIFWITSCNVVVKNDSLTVIAKNLAGERFVVEGAGAIDLLSALGGQVPSQPTESTEGQKDHKKP